MGAATDSARGGDGRAPAADGDLRDELGDAARAAARRDRGLLRAHLGEALLVVHDPGDRRDHLGRGQRDHADPVGSDVVEVAALLPRDVVVHDHRDLGDRSLRDRPRPGLGDEQVGRPHQLGDVVAEAQHRHRRRQRRRELLEFALEGGVAAGHDDEMEVQPGLGQAQGRRQELAAAFAARHQQRDRPVDREPQALADLGLGAGDVLEARMDRVPQQAQPLRRDAALDGALVDLACRHHREVGFGEQPAFVDAAEVGDDGDDRDLLHPGVGAGPQSRVVEQRVDRDDDVGLILGEDVAQPLAVERLAEAHDRAVAAPAVGGVVERAVDRRGIAKGRAIGRPQFGERKRAVGGDVVDAPLEARRSVDLVERGADGHRSGAVSAAGVRDEEEDTFGHPTSARSA